ncbi:MAG: hypothetical protein KKC71_01880 [Chloroflexi bacterium]|nr:hypothetical protein [Chloroflexota bacterium]
MKPMHLWKLVILAGTLALSAAACSPDGRSIFFAYQDIHLGADSPIELHYLSFGALGTGAEYTPIPLPFQFFAKPNEMPKPALWPAK